MIYDKATRSDSHFNHLPVFSLPNEMDGSQTRLISVFKLLLPFSFDWLIALAPKVPHSNLPISALHSNHDKNFTIFSFITLLLVVAMVNLFDNR